MRPTLGGRVRYWREFRQMTQDELADASGVARPHLSRIENDHITDPGVSTIIKLARALRVSIAWIVVDPIDQMEGVPR